MQAWIPVVSSSLYFGKASLVFGQTVFWNQMGFLYQTESFLTACISLVQEPDKPWPSQQPSCTISRKELRRCCSPIGHNNTKHFLCPIRSQHSLDRLEMVRWESVPRGFSACAWKLSSRLFSRPTDCPWVSEDVIGTVENASKRKCGRKSMDVLR